MATLIVKSSSSERFILDGGKIVGVSGDITAERMPEMHVDDITYDNLVAAYGTPVYD